MIGALVDTLFRYAVAWLLLFSLVMSIFITWQWFAHGGNWDGIYLAHVKHMERAKSQYQDYLENKK